jgi:metallo-beta-lactamase class B
MRLSAFRASLMAGVCLAFSASAGEAPGASSPAVQRYVDVAKSLARDEYAFFQDRYCNPNPQTAEAGAAERAKMVIPATKVFDNLYYVGLASVGAWVLQTSEGLILFDALNNAEEAEKFVEGGIVKLGLDPKQIKYLVITHGHGDHFGGVNYIRNKYKPRVLASAADWALMAEREKAAAAGSRFKGLAPVKDMDVTDGQKLTLGDTTVTFYITPGHTPGTISTLLTVKDGGQSHSAAFWGGTGLPGNPAALAQYEASLRRFWGLATAAKTDVLTSNHPYLDLTLVNLPKLQTRKPGDPNPFVIGSASYAAYMGVLHNCVLAAQERQKKVGS